MELKTKQRIALGALFFQSGLCFSSWASRIPDIKESFNLSESDLGAILLIRPLGSLFGLPVAGLIVDNYGSRLSATSGIVAFSISLIFLGMANSVIFLMGSLLFFGLSANLINISLNTQALLVQKNYGKVIMASFHGLWSLAGFCGAAIGALTLQLHMSIQLHFILIAALVVVLLSLSYKHLNNEKEGQGRGKFVLKNPNKELWKLGLIAFFGLLCEGCMYDWSGVYFKEVINAEQGLVAAGFIAYMGTMALGRLVSDSLTNRFGGKSIVIISGILIFSGLLIAVAFPYFGTGILGFLLVGAGTSSVIPLTYSEVGETKKLSKGIALAIVATIGYFGFLLGPPLIGFIAELLNLRASFLLIALVGMAITVISFIDLKKARKAFEMA